ncbi:hypothetical protein B0O99DRAFT_346062 [Bisporella sp. PMI_857]|nr:hypothetical protein B0O99DRAFT_346062 [Bisporella sp. PMI_857]
MIPRGVPVLEIYYILECASNATNPKYEHLNTHYRYTLLCCARPKSIYKLVNALRIYKPIQALVTALSVPGDLGVDWPVLPFPNIPHADYAAPVVVEVGHTPAAAGESPYSNTSAGSGLRGLHILHSWSYTPNWNAQLVFSAFHIPLPPSLLPGELKGRDLEAQACRRDFAVVVLCDGA